MAFTSRFLNSVEYQYSINELELLGAVWSKEHFNYYLYGKLFTVITDHRALLSKMRDIRGSKSYNSCLTHWVDRHLLFDFSVHHLPSLKMGLVDYISREAQQKVVKISTYEEQFLVAKLDAIKLFLLNAENYTDFAARNLLKKWATNKSNSCDKLCSELAQQNREYAEITNKDNTISKLTPNSSHSSNLMEATNIPHSLIALNRPTNHLQQHSSNYKQITNLFQTVLMLSQSDEETLSQINKATPSKIRFADEAARSTAPSAPVTPSTPGTETKNVTALSSDDLYTDAFNFALSKIFSSTLMASLTSKEAILQEMRDCVITGNEDRCRQISPYIHSYWKDVQEWLCMCT